MNKPVELTKIRIIQEKRSDRIRRAYVGNFDEPLFFGVHGGVKQFYGVEPEKEHPSTLDHIVAAAGG